MRYAGCHNLDSLWNKEYREQGSKHNSWSTAGAGKLSEGAKSLGDGIDAVAEGISKLSTGSEQLKMNLETGKTQAKESYQSVYDSFYQIAFAVNCVKNGADPASLTPEQQAGIAKTMAEAGIANTADVTSTTQCGAATGFILKNYAYIQNIVASKLQEAAGGQLAADVVSAKADEQITMMTSGLSQASQAYTLCQGTYTALAEGGEQSFFGGMETLNEKIPELSQGADTLEQGISDLSTGLTSLETAVGSFDTAKEGTICTSLYTLQMNANQLQQEGTAVLEGGLFQLSQQNEALKNGAAKLAEGTAALQKGIMALAEGVDQLNTGAVTLKDGVVQFQEEAIAPLYSLVYEDAQTALDTLKAVITAGQEYQSYLGKADAYQGSVTFVYKTAGVQEK